jgi:hypothetical protein
MDANEKGMDPDLYINRSRTVQAELAAARAVLHTHTSSADTPLGEYQLRCLVQGLGSIVGLLRDADADERRQFCQELGLTLTYQGSERRTKRGRGVELGSSSGYC